MLSAAVFSDFEEAHPRGPHGKFVPRSTTSRGEPVVSPSGHDYDAFEVAAHHSHPDFDRQIGASPAGRLASSLGLDLSVSGVRALLGAAAGASSPSDRVSFDAYGGGTLVVRANAPGFHCEITLFRPREENQGRLVARLQIMRNSSSVSGRSGTEAFCGQIKALRRAGVSHLFLDAAGSATDREHNGYYVWPRLGCEGELTDKQLAKLPAYWRKQMGRSRSLQDLFSLGGGDAWKRHGDDVYCWFDLAESSRSSRNLERYLESRRSEFSLPDWSCFARRRSGGWDPYVPRSGKHAGQPMERNPRTGSVRESADDSSIPWAIPVDDSIPVAELVEPSSVRSESFASRLGSYERGRRIHREIFRSPLFQDLLSARDRVKRRLDLLDRSVGPRMREALDAARAGRPVRPGRLSADDAGALSRLSEAMDYLADVESRFRWAVIDRLSARRPHGPIGMAGLTPESLRPRDDALESLELAGRVVGGLAGRLPGEPPVPPPMLTFAAPAAGGIGREGGLVQLAGYSPSLGVITCPVTRLGVGSAIHELGHHLEGHLPGANEACLAFHEHRRRGERIRPINRIDPDAFGPASDDVVGIEDRFRLVFGDEAAYAGRYYHAEPAALTPQQADAYRAAGFPVKDGPRPPLTEILSMGLQFLYEKPHRLEKDPELFSFLLGVLDGSLRDPPPPVPGR